MGRLERFVGLNKCVVLAYYLSKLVFKLSFFGYDFVQINFQYFYPRFHEQFLKRKSCQNDDSEDRNNKCEAF